MQFFTGIPEKHLYRTIGGATYQSSLPELVRVLETSGNPAAFEVSKVGAGVWVPGETFLKYGDDSFDAKTRERADAEHENAAKINNTLLTTEATVEGVGERLGIVSAQCVFGMNVIKDIFSGARDFFGGRSATVEKGVKDALDAVFSELKLSASELGANAVVGVQYNVSNHSAGTGASMLMISAIGTAVKLNGAAKP